MTRTIILTAIIAALIFDPMLPIKTIEMAMNLKAGVEQLAVGNRAVATWASQQRRMIEDMTREHRAAELHQRCHDDIEKAYKWSKGKISISECD